MTDPVDLARRATFRELLLELENATKREANMKGWPMATLLAKLNAIAHIRLILKDHLDRVPTHV